ncbi:unnamed protein product [Closterium sp. Yama58-4]|nr:unnamed protein product [Closterium sp. Yama58-4]
MAIKTALDLSRFTDWDPANHCDDGTSPPGTLWGQINCDTNGNVFTITDGTGTLCSPGQGCKPNADSLISSRTNNYASDINLMGCANIPTYMDIDDAAAMLNIKSALGVTFTTWAANSPCHVFGSSVAFATEWTGVWCNSDGKVVLLAVDGLGLKGPLHADMSALTALTRVSLTSNFFNFPIASFTSSMKSLPNLVDISMHVNYLYGEIPSFLVNIPKLVSLSAPFNYLMGTVPAPSANVVFLDLANNFLSDIPTVATCYGNINCLGTPSKCSSTGSTQRPAADCAFCATTNGAPPFCWGAGGVCTPNAAAAIAAGTGTMSLATPLARTCVGGPLVVLKDTAAMLALRTALGVTYTTWDTTVPCKIAGQSTTFTNWDGVLCDSTGSVVSLGAAANYLIGSVPALASGLRTLDLRFNFLTDVPAVTYTYCGGNNNCLTTPSKCATVGSVQRPATDCAFCNTTKGVGPFCVGPGGVCTLEGNAAVAAGTVNNFTQPVIPLACMVPPVPLKDTSAVLVSRFSFHNLSLFQKQQAILPPPRLCSSCSRLHYNYFIGDIPSFLVNLPKLTQLGRHERMPLVSVASRKGMCRSPACVLLFEMHAVCFSSLMLLSSLSASYARIHLPMALPFASGAMYNYLTGSVPALASGLRSLEVRSNFLTDVPTANYTYCGGAGNCLLTPSKCASGAAGSTQRSAADCAFCGTSNGVGTFCWGAGGVCTPDVAAAVAAGMVNLPTEPTRPMSCVGSPVVPIKEIGVMLALKSSLGMSSTTWGPYVPCTIKGTTAPVATWAGVLCDADGNVLKM